MKYRVGEMIKAYRKQNGLSQKELADIVGITQPALSSIESSKTEPSSENLKLIANALKVTIDVLTSGIPSSKVGTLSKANDTTNNYQSTPMTPLIQMPPTIPNIPEKQISSNQQNILPEEKIPSKQQNISAPEQPVSHPIHVTTLQNIPPNPAAPQQQYLPPPNYPVYNNYPPLMMPIAYAPVPPNSVAPYDQNNINWPQRYFELLDRFQQLQNEHSIMKTKLALYEFKFGSLKEEK